MNGMSYFHKRLVAQADSYFPRGTLSPALDGQGAPCMKIGIKGAQKTATVGIGGIVDRFCKDGESEASSILSILKLAEQEARRLADASFGQPGPDAGRTVSYHVKLAFSWDEGPDVREFVLEVPEGVTPEEVSEALETANQELWAGGDEADGEDGNICYGELEASPQTLVDYLCGKQGWQGRLVEYEIELEF